MAQIRHLYVGGVVAMGFDPAGDYLLVISHSGRGVFSTRSWERVGRDPASAYPIAGYGVGIGPIDGVRVPVKQMPFDRERISLTGPNGSIIVEYESGTITVTDRNN